MPTNQEPDQTPPSVPSSSAAGELTIANHTDEEVTYTITPSADGYDMVGDDTPVEELRAEWTGADSLEHSLAVAEKVGIGPSCPACQDDTTVVCPTCEPESFGEHRFGDRLRKWLPDSLPHMEEQLGHELERLADAIDRDAAESRREQQDEIDLKQAALTAMASEIAGVQALGRLNAKLWDEADMFAAELIGGLDRENIDRSGEPVGNAILRAARGLDPGYLRARVERLVEELRYSAAPLQRGRDGEPDERDVLDAEPFLERLGGIFGGAAPSARAELMERGAERIKSAERARIKKRLDRAIAAMRKDPAIAEWHADEFAVICRNACSEGG